MEIKHEMIINELIDLELGIIKCERWLDNNPYDSLIALLLEQDKARKLMLLSHLKD